MWRLLLLLLLVGACSAPVPPEAAPGPTRRLRLMTWNVHNLFDSVDDPYEDDVLTPGQLEAKLDLLARVLQQADADLVALQEVENSKLLRQLASRSAYPWMILEEGNDTVRGIDVGFLSRVRPDGHLSHAGDPLPEVAGAPPDYRFSRDCLEVHLDPVVILVNHFKSQAGGGRESDAKRRAQAERVEAIAAGHRYVAVVGDLNASPESWSLEPLLGGGLVDVFGGRRLADRATWLQGKRRSVLDYVLLSPDLARGVVDARVLGGPDVAAASDHRPVVVDLDVPAPEGGPSEPGETPGR